MKTRYLNCWIPREANRTDHYLAKWSLRTGLFGSFGLCNGPHSLRDVIIREEAFSCVVFPVLFVGIKFSVHQKCIKDGDKKVIVYRHNVCALDKNVKKWDLIQEQIMPLKTISNWGFHSISINQIFY